MGFEMGTTDEKDWGAWDGILRCHNQCAYYIYTEEAII